ncbi:MAG: hypothetical protein WCW01_02640 [Gammaproteobacteria bacterium]
MWRSREEGTTGQLVQLCFFYFLFYVINGVVVKYFQFYPLGPKFSNVQYLAYSTLGSISIPTFVVLAWKWYKFKSNRLISIGKLKFPSEFLYIAPAGLCTAIIVLFTTLLYSFNMSVMVAMVIMRASVIVVGRIVDAIQIKQGILKREVYWQENFGVIFALLAASTDLFWVKSGDFAIIKNFGALIVLCSYVAAYALRIYIMNYYKNTRPKDAHYSNKSYFGVEQLISTSIIVILALVFLKFGSGIQFIHDYQTAVFNPSANWGWAVLGGTAFGFIAFFSVFIFMFKGRTATFAGLVNRLTSLIAGTVATLLVWLFFQGKFPSPQEWLSLVFIFIAIGFITSSEKRRVKELVAKHEIAKS